MCTGGAETMLLDIVNEQSQEHDLILMVVNDHYDSALFSELDPSVKLILLNRKVGSRNPYPLFRLNFLLWSLKPDIIHCHNDNLIQLILLSGSRKKAVLTVHDTLMEAVFFKFYAALFAISETVCEKIKTESNCNAILVPNGVSFTSIKSVSGNHQNNLPVFSLIQIGRLLHEKKGQHLTIEAMQLLKEWGHAGFRLCLVGTGPSEAFLKQLTRLYGLEDEIEFAGLKDRSWIYTHLKDYQLLIHPSLYEGFGLTVVEGMAAGIPVLVSDTGGPMEIIQHGLYGSYFQTGNVHMLAKAILTLKAEFESETIRQKTKLAYRYVKQNYSINNTAAAYCANYLQLLNTTV